MLNKVQHVPTVSECNISVPSSQSKSVFSVDDEQTEEYEDLSDSENLFCMN